jgi:uncharacterized protein (DUF305 family)
VRRAGQRGVGGDLHWQTSPVDVRTGPPNGPPPSTDPADPADPAPVVSADGRDDDVVLSWWQHPVNVIGLLVAIALIGGMVGWLIADAGDDASGGDVDVGFLHDMRAHHEQAVQLGYMYLALEDTDPALRTVARSIITGQSIDVGRMIQLLRDLDAPEAAETEETMAWMGMPTPVDEMPGMASEPEIDAFGATSSGEADETFVELMVDHHRGGIHMAEAAASLAEHPEVRAMAAAIADSQADEIGELERLID